MELRHASWKDLSRAAARLAKGKDQLAWPKCFVAVVLKELASFPNANDSGAQCRAEQIRSQETMMGLMAR